MIVWIGWPFKYVGHDHEDLSLKRGALIWTANMRHYRLPTWESKPHHPYTVEYIATTYTFFTLFFFFHLSYLVNFYFQYGIGFMITWITLMDQVRILQADIHNNNFSWCYGCYEDSNLAFSALLLLLIFWNIKKIE